MGISDFILALIFFVSDKEDNLSNRKTAWRDSQKTVHFCVILSILIRLSCTIQLTGM